jgi:hypothetical protein
MKKTVKKSITLTMLLLLGMSLFVGCGGSAQKGETIQVKYYSFSLLPGWYLNGNGGDTHYDVKNEAFKGKVVLGINAIRKPDVILPDIIKQFEGNQQIGDVEINGIIFFFFLNQRRKTIDLLESKKAPNAIAVFSIRLNDISIEQATPLLKTLKMNSDMIEIDEEAIKAKFRK